MLFTHVSEREDELLLPDFYLGILLSEINVLPIS